MIRAAAIDFAVPTHYTIGERFDTFAEAEAAARATIREIPGGWSRAFVDVRVRDAQADHPIERVEVFR